jgi:hypothetical protein
MHLVLANPLRRQLEERAQKIQGDKKHMTRISHKVTAPRCPIQHMKFLA